MGVYLPLLLHSISDGGVDGHGGEMRELWNGREGGPFRRRLGNQNLIDLPLFSYGIDRGRIIWKNVIYIIEYNG